MYLNWTPFEEFQIDEALAEAPLDGEAEADDMEIEEHNRQAETYREKVGLIAVIDLAFVADGITHICQLNADWFTAFEELVAEEEGSGEYEPLEQRVDKSLVNKWASSLANHPNFGACKKSDQRVYLLEELAGRDYKMLPVREILRRAETLYIFEVRSKHEEELRKQAKTLREQGLNLSAIAQKLGISRDRVSGLLTG